MFPTAFVSHICRRDFVTSVRGVPNVICCSPVILNGRNGKEKEPWSYHPATNQHEDAVWPRTMKRHKSRRFQAPWQPDWRNRTSSWVRAIVVLGLCEAQMLCNPDLSITGLEDKFWTRFPLVGKNISFFNDNNNNINMNMKGNINMKGNWSCKSHTFLDLEDPSD